MGLQLSKWEKSSNFSKEGLKPEQNPCELNDKDGKLEEEIIGKIELKTRWMKLQLRRKGLAKDFTLSIFDAYLQFSPIPILVFWFQIRIGKKWKRKLKALSFLLRANDGLFCRTGVSYSQYDRITTEWEWIWRLLVFLYFIPYG